MKKMELPRYWQKKRIQYLVKTIKAPKKLLKTNYLHKGEYPIIDQSNKKIAGWTYEEDSIIKPNKPVIVFGDHTCCIKYINFPFAQGADGIKIMQTIPEIIPYYLFLVLQQDPIAPEGYKRHFSKVQEKEILLPPLPEQEKIVEVLETWDEYLETLNKTIRLKKKTKNGLLQKLLKGKIRLKNFNSPWKNIKIGDCLKIKHGKTQLNVENPNGKYPIFGTGGIIGTANKFIYNKPSVLIGRKGTINKPRYLENPFWTIDTLFYSEINAQNLPKYMYYLFLTINWKIYNEGSGIPSLSASTISSINISIPSLEEQTAIAEILTTADNEIELLEKKRQLIEAQKKFLLNNLITGKIRLPEFIKKDPQ